MAEHQTSSVFLKKRENSDRRPLKPLRDVLLTSPEVCAQLKISKSTLNNWVKRGIFPEPERIGPRAIRWKQSSVKGLIENKTA